jgi:hypothetical protein
MARAKVMLPLKWQGQDRELGSIVDLPDDAIGAFGNTVARTERLRFAGPAGEDDERFGTIVELTAVERADAEGAGAVFVDPDLPWPAPENDVAVAAAPEPAIGGFEDEADPA